MRKIASLLIVISFVAAAVFGQAAAASPAPSQAPSTGTAVAKSIEGTIVSITLPNKEKKTDGELVIVDSAKKQITIVLGRNVKVFDAAKKPIAFSALVKDKTVAVEYVERNGKLDALNVIVK